MTALEDAQAAQRNLDSALQQRDLALVQARDAGESWAMLMQVSNLSRAGVGKALQRGAQASR